MTIGNSSQNPANLRDINVRSSTYFIANTAGVCRHCHESTRLIALALPRDHESLYAESDAETAGPAAEVWQLATLSAFVFYIEYLPDGVLNRIRQLLPFYGFAHSAATMSSFWSNHCENCGSLQVDHEMFCEPDGAFTPASEIAAAEIELVHIDAPFAAAAAGYALQPEFFEFMRRA